MQFIKRRGDLDSEPDLCSVCERAFIAHAVSLGGVELFRARYCQTCVEVRLTAGQCDDRGRKHACDWERICPIEYRDTDLAHSGISSQCRVGAVEWDARSNRGLAFIGDTGTGKTRSLFAALHHAHDLGRRCESISHNRFSRVVAEAFAGDVTERSRAKGILRRISNAEVLLFDDLGKAPNTERADAEFEELVEYRTSHGLPILWTANGSGEWLARRFGADRGEPIVRRLAEFCRVLKVS